MIVQELPSWCAVGRHRRRRVKRLFKVFEDVLQTKLILHALKVIGIFSGTNFVYIWTQQFFNATALPPICFPTLPLRFRNFVVLCLNVDSFLMIPAFAVFQFTFSVKSMLPNLMKICFQRSEKIVTESVGWAIPISHLEDVIDCEVLQDAWSICCAIIVEKALKSHRRSSVSQ